MESECVRYAASENAKRRATVRHSVWLPVLYTVQSNFGRTNMVQPNSFIVLDGGGGRASGQAVDGVRNVRPGAKDVDEHAE